MEIFSRPVFPAFMLALTLASGFWLSHTAKPLNSLLFNIHKLIALAAVVLTGVQLRNLLMPAAAPSDIFLFLILAGLCAAALFASGALMSIGKNNYALMRTIHRVGSALLVLSLGAAVYLLNALIPTP